MCLCAPSLQQRVSLPQGISGLHPQTDLPPNPYPSPNRPPSPNPSLSPNSSQHLSQVPLPIHLLPRIRLHHKPISHPKAFCLPNHPPLLLYLLRPLLHFTSSPTFPFPSPFSPPLTLLSPFLLPFPGSTPLVQLRVCGLVMLYVFCRPISILPLAGKVRKKCA